MVKEQNEQIWRNEELDKYEEAVVVLISLKYCQIYAESKTCKI